VRFDDPDDADKSSAARGAAELDCE